MTLPYNRNRDALNAITPAFRARDVTPADGSDLPDYTTTGPTKALWIGVGGDVEVDLEGDSDIPSSQIVFKNLSSGELIPIAVKRVRDANTDAQDIVALY